MQLGYADIVAQMLELDGKAAGSVTVNETVVERTVGNCTSAFGGVGPQPGKKTAITGQAPCGTGKTTYFINEIDKARRADPNARFCYITPRAALCRSVWRLLSKLPALDDNGNEVLGATEKCHLYSSGPDNGWCKIVVTTFESLAQTVGIPVRHYTHIIVDESETALPGLFASPTFSGDGKLREKAIAAAIAVLARADVVTFIDKDITLSTRLFIGLYMTAAPGDFDILTLRLKCEQRIVYKQLPDAASLVNVASIVMRAGQRIAIFEPSVKWGAAYRAALEKYGNVLLMHGGSEVKEEFCADPDAYLRAHDVQCLIYTTAMGVGVSVDGVDITVPGNNDDAYFHTVVVVPRDFLSAQAVHQGEWRIRRSQNDIPGRVGQPGTRVVYTVKIPSRSSLYKLRNPETVRDAMKRFGDMVSVERERLQSWAFLGERNALTAALELKVSAKAVVAAAMWGADKLARHIHATAKEHADFDTKATTRETLGRLASNKKDRKELKRLRDVAAEGLASEGVIKDGDGARDVRRKFGPLLAVGPLAIQENGRLTNPAYAALNITPGNVRRVVALALGPDLASEVDATAPLDSEPMHQLDDEAGVTVAFELGLLQPVFEWFGVGTLEALWAAGPLVAGDAGGAGAGGGGGPDFNGILAQLAAKSPERYDARAAEFYRANKKAASKARWLINAYFGCKVINGMHGGQPATVNKDVLCALMERIPAHMEKRSMGQGLGAATAAAVEAAAKKCNEVYGE